MVCPLCQNEYGEGVAECSECHVRLVATPEEAAERRVELWSGEDQGRLDDLLAALDAAKIASCFEERTISGATPGFNPAFLPMTPTLEWVVWVLREDAQRAEAVFQQVEQKEQSEDSDVDEGGGK